MDDEYTPLGWQRINAERQEWAMRMKLAALPPLPVRIAPETDRRRWDDYKDK